MSAASLLLSSVKRFRSCEARIILHVVPTVPEASGGGAGLASNRGCETGGHAHSARTHQQVLVMGAILGLKVRHGVKLGAGGVNKQARDERGRGRRGRGRQGYERSLVIDMPDITITLLIQRDTNTDEVRGSDAKTKAQRKGGWGGEHVLVTRSSQDSHFLQIQTFWLLQANTAGLALP